MKFFCLLVFSLGVACAKKAAVTSSNLPQPDPVVIENSYNVVTAASSIALNTGTEYRLALVQFASFFKFDRSVKNGDLYYAAILESAKQFKPLKFYISNSTGAIVAITSASKAESDNFHKEWQQP